MKTSAWLTLTLALAAAWPARAAPVPGMGDWTLTLQARDLDGNGTIDAWYDIVLNITWLANANSAATGSPLTGRMNFVAANSWVANLTVAGVSGWRLPRTLLPPPAVHCDAGQVCNGWSYNVPVLSSELAHMYYATLGNRATLNTDGVAQAGGLVNTGPFSNVVDFAYWVSGPVPPTNNMNPLAWRFHMENGRREVWLQSQPVNYIWAVHDGDVGSALIGEASLMPVPVPEPAGVVLWSAGLAAVVAAARRRRADA